VPACLSCCLHNWLLPLVIPSAAVPRWFQGRGACYRDKPHALVMPARPQLLASQPLPQPPLLPLYPGLCSCWMLIMWPCLRCKVSLSSFQVYASALLSAYLHPASAVQLLDDDGETRLEEVLELSRLRPLCTDDSLTVPLSRRKVGQPIDCWHDDGWWEVRAGQRGSRAAAGAGAAWAAGRGIGCW